MTLLVKLVDFYSGMKKSRIIDIFYRHFKHANHSPTCISIQPVENIFMMEILVKHIVSTLPQTLRVDS